MLTTHLNTGGITSYLYVLGGELVKARHNVTVASSGGNMVELFSQKGIGVLPLNIRTKSELNPRIYFALGKLISFVRENRIEIVHCHTRITQVMGYFLQKLTGAVFVSTCHGFFKPRLFRRMFPCWGRGVIAISPAVKQHLEQDFAVGANKICLIKNGIEIASFPFMSAELRAQKRRELKIDGCLIVGIIARLSDVKGHSVLINAWPAVIKKIKYVKLMIVGQGNEEERLRKQVHDLGMEDSVIFLPVVNQTQHLLPLFDIFVMPSLQEGLGLSVMEAQAAGLPVIASRVGGIPSLIEHGKTGMMLEPNDPEDLALSIIDLLEHPEKAKDIAAHAREFAEKEFSAETMLRETVRFYKSVLGEGLRL